jgi:hypothetical protein
MAELLMYFVGSKMDLPLTFYILCNHWCLSLKEMQQVAVPRWNGSVKGKQTETRLCIPQGPQSGLPGWEVHREGTKWGERSMRERGSQRHSQILL